MWHRSRTLDPGSWADRTDRPRVLIEDPDGAVLSSCEEFLRRDGFDVAVCRGPQADGVHHCPLVTSGECSLTDGADVIYTALSWHDPKSREVLQAIRARHPQTPVVVEIPQPQVERFADLLAGCQLVLVPSGRASMRRALQDALAAAPAH